MTAARSSRHRPPAWWMRASWGRAWRARGSLWTRLTARSLHEVGRREGDVQRGTDPEDPDDLPPTAHRLQHAADRAAAPVPVVAAPAGLLRVDGLRQAGAERRFRSFDERGCRWILAPRLEGRAAGRLDTHALPLPAGL